MNNETLKNGHGVRRFNDGPNEFHSITSNVSVSTVQNLCELKILLLFLCSFRRPNDGRTAFLVLKYYCNLINKIWKLFTYFWCRTKDVKWKKDFHFRRFFFFIRSLRTSRIFTHRQTATFIPLRSGPFSTTHKQAATFHYSFCVLSYEKWEWQTSNETKQWKKKKNHI